MIPGQIVAGSSASCSLGEVEKHDAVREPVPPCEEVDLPTDTLELTPGQIEDLRNGRIYVQIHSERAPDGNLRGWLLR